MKALLLAAGLVFASQASANVLTDHAGTYESQGKWKDATGAEDSWTATLTIAKEDTDAGVAVTLTETTTVRHGEESHEFESELKFVHVENYFFDVVVGEETVGQAYCYGRTCHYSLVKEGETHEETLVFVGRRGRRILRTGSTYKADEYRVAWRGYAVRN